MNPSFAASLIALAPLLPRHDIYGEAGIYLSRYTLSTLPTGGHVYLHHFHRSDIDRDLHNHPWGGTSLILTGGYDEERRDLDGPSVNRRRFRPGCVNVLKPDTFHRVDLLTSDCWTLFVASERVQSWGFWDRDTGLFTPWRDAIIRRGLPVVEYADRATRAELPTLPEVSR